MKIKNKVKLVALSLIFCSFSFLNQGRAETLDKCSNLNHPVEDLTLEDLVKKSEFIGLYLVVDATYNPDLTLGKKGAFSYKLVNELSLKGDTPQSINLDGLEPLKQIPPYYFSILESHENFNPEKVSLKGGTWARIKMPGGECHFSPEFMMGYTYLIFSHESRVSFEPIFSIEFDNWFQMVKTEIGKPKKEK